MKIVTCCTLLSILLYCTTWHQVEGQVHLRATCQKPNYDFEIKHVCYHCRNEQDFLAFTRSFRGEPARLRNGNLVTTNHVFYGKDRINNEIKFVTDTYDNEATCRIVNKVETWTCHANRLGKWTSCNKHGYCTAQSAKGNGHLKDIDCTRFNNGFADLTGVAPPRRHSFDLGIPPPIGVAPPRRHSFDLGILAPIGNAPPRRHSFDLGIPSPIGNAPPRRHSF